MKITAIQVQNVRGFQRLYKTELSESINIFIGPNNAGKSTLLNCIFQLQRTCLTKSDITIGSKFGTIDIYYSGEHAGYIQGDSLMIEKLTLGLAIESRKYTYKNGVQTNDFSKIAETEPYNLIYPYLSKRKATEYTNTINEVNTNSVRGDFANLYSKIDRLVASQHPMHKEYIDACNAILGFEVSTLAKGDGKKAVYFVDNFEEIPLTAMGEGVANILGLVTDLCMAKNKIFLIEEPENDIHPKALKSLLKVIIEKASTNQFFISTHSNIVMKYLGGVTGSKVFNVTNDIRDSIRKKLFVSNVEEISNNPEDRRKVLEELGYDFFDFDLWKGWLFLEESSAEILIRDYFIDWFVPSLKNKLRTFSAGGTSSITTKFEDFNRLFVFLHMELTYKNRVWVIIDAGEEESKIINEMKEKYIQSGWGESNFGQFSEHDFEKYYPEEFQPEVEAILQLTNKQEKRKVKKELIDAVKLWIKVDPDRAKEQFRISAKEIIGHLKQIDSILNK